jgi:L-lactate dehydrogenase complex protein LldG
MSARASILERVRRAQRTGRIPAATAGHATQEPVVAAPIGTDSHERLARFLAELTALGVEHYLEESAAHVRARIGALVGDHAVLAWDVDRLPYSVGEALHNPADGSSPRQVQAAAEIGLTGCDGAIAETGSLALLSRRGQPRAASLLPPVHIAVVRRSDLRASMGEFFAEHAREIAEAACCTFVTGPSRTADIELTLTLGVHGPGKVIVVVGP